MSSSSSSSSSSTPTQSPLASPPEDGNSPTISPTTTTFSSPEKEKAFQEYQELMAPAATEQGSMEWVCHNRKDGLNRRVPSFDEVYTRNVPLCYEIVIDRYADRDRVPKRPLCLAPSEDYEISPPQWCYQYNDYFWTPEFHLFYAPEGPAWIMDFIPNDYDDWEGNWYKQTTFSSGGSPPFPNFTFPTNQPLDWWYMQPVTGTCQDLMYCGKFQQTEITFLECDPAIHCLVPLGASTAAYHINTVGCWSVMISFLVGILLSVPSSWFL